MLQWTIVSRRRRSEYSYSSTRGVNKTLVSERDWNKIREKSKKGNRPRLKVNRTKFRPFSTKYTLPIMGRIKCSMKAHCGQEKSTIIYMVKGETESLL